MTYKATLNQNYTDMLRRFCKHFDKAVNPLDKMRGAKTGYVFIFDRSADKPVEYGYIDIATNLENESIIKSLEAALVMIKKQQSEGGT